MNPFTLRVAARGARHRLARAAQCGGLALLIAGTVVGSLAAHDLFLKPEAWFVRANTSVRVAVLNGTFISSEGAVTRDRLRDLTIAGPRGVTHGDTSAWIGSGKTVTWSAPVGDAGTYVLGASLSPRTLALKGADFNTYLGSEGLPDVLAARKAAGELDLPARERYSKHVKAVIQVSRPGGTAYSTPLGYPAELVPLDDPYLLHHAGTLRVRALVDGQPVAGQVVLAGARSPRGTRIAEREVRTDADGIATVRVRGPGTWYVKFIRMVRVAPTPTDSVTHESKWATLTFAVR